MAKPKGSSGALVKVVGTATTSAAAHANELIALIERRKQRITEDFYDIGEALRELQKKKLYAALGFESLGDLVEARKLMGRSQAYKLVEIVSTVPRAAALTIGAEKAYALARYVEASPTPTTPAIVMSKGMVVAGKHVAVDDLSIRQVVAATRALRGSGAKTKTKRDDAQTAAEHDARTLQASLRARGAKHAIVTTVRRKGGAWIRLELPIDEARAHLSKRR